jgi:hypothetical protein
MIARAKRFIQAASLTEELSIREAAAGSQRKPVPRHCARRWTLVKHFTLIED